ncbi:hypothetical protein [Anoxynatronum buryatiense]|nr:hypothetical protein [Anoxynatronum buryatiense]
MPFLIRLKKENTPIQMERLYLTTAAYVTAVTIASHMMVVREDGAH